MCLGIRKPQRFTLRMSAKNSFVAYLVFVQKKDKAHGKKKKPKTLQEDVKVDKKIIKGIKKKEKAHEKKEGKKGEKAEEKREKKEKK